MSGSYFGAFDGSNMNFQTVSAGLSTTILASIFAISMRGWAGYLSLV